MTVRTSRLYDLARTLNSQVEALVKPTIMRRKKKKNEKWVVRVMGKVVSDVFTDKDKAIEFANGLELSEVVRFP